MGAWSWPPRAELDILEKPDWHGFNIDLDVRAAVRGGANGSDERSAHPRQIPSGPLAFERKKRTRNHFEPLRQPVWRSMLPSRRWGQKVESMVLAERR